MLTMFRLFLLVTLCRVSWSFTVGPSRVLIGVPSRLVGTTKHFAEEVEVQAVPPQAEAIEPPVMDEDPLMTAMTRGGDIGSGKTVRLPFFGDTPVENLGVLAATGVVAFAGVIVVIGLINNSQDELVQLLTSEKTMYEIYKPDESTCRGLCSSQADDLDTMKGFLDFFSKK